MQNILLLCFTVTVMNVTAQVKNFSGVQRIDISTVDFAPRTYILQLQTGTTQRTHSLIVQ